MLRTTKTQNKNFLNFMEGKQNKLSSNLIICLIFSIKKPTRVISTEAGGTSKMSLRRRYLYMKFAIQFQIKHLNLKYLLVINLLTNTKRYGKKI